MRLTRSVRLAAILALAVSAIGVPIAAQGAEPPVDCSWNGFSYDCHTKIAAPGRPAGALPSAIPSASGLTPGAKRCQLEGKAVPCSNEYGSFNNNASCSGYAELAADQDPPPAGQLEGSGAWYQCTYACAVLDNFNGICPAGVGALNFWSTTPPPGVDRYTPAQAAAALARSFRLDPITIGMAPARNVHADDPPATAPYRRTWVGVPVWLWVAEPTPLTYGPYAQTATLGGVTVTARASVTQIDWTSGAGNDITCAAGTPFDRATAADEAATDSPTCGFRFEHASTDQAGDVWNVTATSHWIVSWTGGGQTGTLQLANLTATVQVHVGELQSVNLPVTADQRGQK